MTQASRPQADNIANYPVPSDPGPYSADQWAQVFQVLFTGDQQTTQGPVQRYLNELEGTDNGTTQVLVDTGAGLINGHLLISSEQETFVIPAGPVAGRQDRVVMVENNSNTEVTQTTAARPLLFPNDLSEYTATPGVPAYSARLAIVRGNDAGALPAIDQTTALYMIELYRYSINSVPTISSQDDRRVFTSTSTPGMHFIAESVLVGSTQTVTFDDIPQIYRHLQIVGLARTNYPGPGSDALFLRFNSDSANNYDSISSIESHPATLATGENIADSELQAGFVSGNVVADQPGSFTIEIPGYRGTVFRKTIHAYGGAIEDVATGDLDNWQTSGTWRSTNAITRIDIINSGLGVGGINFLAGSVFSLYGRS